MRAARPVACLLALFAALALANNGCEAIVSGDVPQFQCSGTSSSACPQGQYCNGSGCTACTPPGDDPCDGYDNDCDGKIDDGPLSDHDSDGYPICGFRDPKTLQFSDADCDDHDPTVHPNAPEVCDGKDHNCDGMQPGEGCPAGDLCYPGQTPPCKNPNDTTQVCTDASCTAPLVCDHTSGKCGPPPTVDLGGKCTSNTECNSQLCGDSGTLGSPYTSANGNVCTTPCCTSAQCPADFVCYSPGTGGDYCVKASTLSNRSIVGAGAPGATCGRGGDCRSGLCTNGKCVDTCCGDRDCTNGTACTLSNASGANVFECAPAPGNARQNQSCQSNTDCTSGICYDYGFGYRFCLDACCGSQACGSISAAFTTYPAVCYDVTSQDVPQLASAVVPVCIAVQTAGTGTLGSACSANKDCRSYRCDTASGKCTDVCCTDADCASAGAGWACRPQTVGSGLYLRCTHVTTP